MLSVEEMAEGAARQAEEWTPPAAALESTPRIFLRRSHLGAWFPGIQWEIVDHNFPECQRYDNGRGLIVVRPTNPESRVGLHFVLQVPVPWRLESPASVAIAHPSIVDAHYDGDIVAWTALATPVSSVLEVATWLRKRREAHS